jgi:hypothetical protein
MKRSSPPGARSRHRRSSPSVVHTSPSVVRRDGHLAGFGAAVDLDQPALQRASAIGRQLRRQRRGGRQHQVHRRQGHARQQQRLQVEGRGDQRARCRHRFQRCHDVGRIERPAGCRSRHRPAGPAARWTRSRSCAAAAPWPTMREPCQRRQPLHQFGQAFGLGLDVGTSWPQRLVCGCGAPVDPRSAGTPLPVRPGSPARRWPRAPSPRLHQGPRQCAPVGGVAVHQQHRAAARPGGTWRSVSGSALGGIRLVWPRSRPRPGPARRDSGPGTG